MYSFLCAKGFSNHFSSLVAKYDVASTIAVHKDIVHIFNNCHTGHTDIDKVKKPGKKKCYVKLKTFNCAKPSLS